MILAALLVAAGAARAQPVLPEAERVFEEAVAHFEAGDFDRAREAFADVRVRFPRHRRTDAALLMQAKALYRAGRFEACARLLEGFPGGALGAEAERTRSFSLRRLALEAELDRAIRLGVALPLGRSDLSLAQSLFTGIRIAVDDWNRQSDRLVRIVFRDSKNAADGAGRAVESLVREGVDVILGPLYSGEAEAAAAVADRRRTVMVAPLATARAIARGREHVFQANPPSEARGTFLAREAVQRLGATYLGLASDETSAVSKRMGDGFHREAERLGANVVFHASIDNSAAWYRLADDIEPFGEVDAVFLPIHGERATESNRMIVGTLDRLANLESAPRLLGGTAWNNAALARYGQDLDIAFADVFFVNENRSAVRRFKARYRRSSGGEDPGRLAYVGYDVASFVVGLAAARGEVPLRMRLRTAPTYEGLGTRIRFDRDRVNEAMFLLTYTTGGVERVR